jgi:hypothetical protein
MGHFVRRHVKLASAPRRGSRGLRGLVLPLAALLAAWLFAPAVVPLYDGVGFPDEPYRYVAPPAGTAATKAATGGSATARMSAGATVDTLTVLTGEQGPQFQLYIPVGFLTGPTTATTVTAIVTPTVPDTPLAGMTFDGNMYSATAKADATGPLTVAYSAASAGLGGAVQLRTAIKDKGDPVVVYRPAKADAWRPLATTPTGQDVYGTDLVGLGDYALAFGVPNSPASSGLKAVGAGPSMAPIFWLGGAFLGVILLLIVGFRLTRAPKE